MKKNKKKSVNGQKNPIERFKEFFEESKVEMKKVAYPSQKQTVATCTSVLVLVLIVSVYLGIVDILLSKIIQVILS
ncbi:preprotein translocase subunit SecE [Desulfothermus okinawensis JCM 13304]